MKNMKNIIYVKCLMLFIMLLLPTVTAQTTNYTVQYSLDNETFFTPTFVDPANCEARQDYLEHGKRVYWRVKSENSSFVYAQDRTEDDGQMELAIIIGLFIITILGALGTFYFSSELKFFFFLGTVLSLVFNTNMAAQLAQQAAMDTVIIDLLWTSNKVLLWVFWFLFLYSMIKLFFALRVSRKTAVEVQNPSLNRELPK
jgi:predicted membrane protein